MLPSEVPDSINCRDQNGTKQGWWIYYSIEFCQADIPDQLSKGDFVPEYTYGKYKDGKKIGTWKSINNVHLIYPISEEKYEYYGDTVMITSRSPRSTNVVIHSPDSSLLTCEILPIEEKFPLKIICSKQDGQCEMMYRGKVIKSFSINYFEFEQDRCSLLHYKQNMRVIDNGMK